MTANRKARLIGLIVLLWILLFAGVMLWGVVDLQSKGFLK